MHLPKNWCAFRVPCSSGFVSVAGRLVLAAALTSACAGVALAEDYVPGVAVVPEVRTPSGELRTYRTGLGYSYWRSDLPIYKGDKVLLNVFVCLGGADLAETRVRIDNEEIDHRTAAPWSSQLDTGTLKEGYHFVEAWAKTKGNKPHAATATVTLFIDPHEPGASPQAPLVEPLQSSPDPAVLTLPPAQGGPSVTLSCDNAAGQQSLAKGTPVSVADSVVFSVAGPGPSEGFVYALYRGGAQAWKSDVLPVGTHIKLRRSSPGNPGLLPGSLTLVVWGTDKDGRIGPARKVELNVPGVSSPGEAVPFESAAQPTGVARSGELKEGTS
jgi:hypothetical protein